MTPSSPEAATLASATTAAERRARARRASRTEPVRTARGLGAGPRGAARCRSTPTPMRCAPLQRCTHACSARPPTRPWPRRTSVARACAPRPRPPGGGGEARLCRRETPVAVEIDGVLVEGVVDAAFRDADDGPGRWWTSRPTCRSGRGTTTTSGRWRSPRTRHRRSDGRPGRGGASAALIVAPGTGTKTGALTSAGIRPTILTSPCTSTHRSPSGSTTTATSARAPATPRQHVARDRAHRR